MNDGRKYEPGMPRHSVSAGAAVIRDDGLVLAIKRRDNGAWVQPGGIVELDEDPRATVIREVLEETGVQVHPEELVGIYKNMSRGVVSLVFRCSVVAGEAHPTDEASDVAWLSADEIKERMDEAFAVRLLDALAGNGPQVRVHDGRNLISGINGVSR